MRKIATATLILATSLAAVAQQPQSDAEKMKRSVIIKATEKWDPQPEVVTAGNYDNMIAPPSDAIVLFGGDDLSQWESRNGGEAAWDIEDGVLYVKPKTGPIKSKQSFGDCQLHIEWMIPEGTEGESQQRGNSGLFFQEQYEVQILDNYNNKSYANGQAGSIYKQHPPLVNACSGQGRWNVYDVIFTAPTFREDGTLRDYARITVLHNGVLVQNNSLIMGPTEYSSLPEYKAHGKLPILLQDHSNRIAFRNIWIREL